MAKSVVVTGTSTGIGRACVDRLAAEGWTVYAGVRKVADADDLKAKVSGGVRPVLLDVTDADQIEALCSLLRTDLGEKGLDALVNNAGVSEGGPIETVTDEQWRWHFDVNVFGVVNLTRELLPLLRTAKGRVINIGSVGGRASMPMMAPYSAGKHAIEAISESLRFEVADFGMKVACIEPGEIATAIWGKANDQLAQHLKVYDAATMARYDRHMDMIYGFVADGAKRGMPPSKVADSVYHAMTAAKPKHRYLVGSDAKVVGVVTRLPDGLRHRILALNMSVWARAGKKVRAASP
jgi:NAD(P)-dependent dehydrogenase (short-subunit alcohol dehydrogenase family)